MSHDPSNLFHFAGFTLDLDRGRLMDGSTDLILRAKSFALLSHLVRARGRVVTKDELLSALWPDVTVTEASLTQCMYELRQVLGPRGEGLVRTVPRRGYLFQDGPAPVAPPEKALRPDGIAILPFVVTSGDPAEAMVIDGVAHDLILRLARLRSFHVIARGSAFALRHLAEDPSAAGRALGVAYAVGGTATLSSDRFQLWVDLVQSETGAVVWSDAFSGPRAELPVLLPELTDRLLQSLELQVTLAEARRALALPVERLDAWEHFHAGMHHALRFDPDRIGLALQDLTRASELAPGFARAHAGRSFCHYFRTFTGTTPDRAAEIAAARASAEDALAADEFSPSAHWAYGRALWLADDPDGCLTHCERSVALSPGFALGHYMVGFVETHAGDPGRGLSHLDRVLALSPFDPFLASIQITRALALVRLNRMEAAAACAREAARQPNARAYPALLAPAALILAGAGRTEEARQIVTRLREASPQFGLADLNRSLHRMTGEVLALFRRSAPLIGL